MAAIGILKGSRSEEGSLGARRPTIILGPASGAPLRIPAAPTCSGVQLIAASRRQSWPYEFNRRLAVSGHHVGVISAAAALEAKDLTCCLYRSAVQQLMIGGFRDGWLRAFFVDGETAKSIPADLERRLFRKLQLIDDATTDADLCVPPSNHLEKLSGHLAGCHSIRVNQQWRLIFRWNGSAGEASDLYLDDHSCR